MYTQTELKLFCINPGDRSLEFNIREESIEADVWEVMFSTIGENHFQIDMCSTDEPLHSASMQLPSDQLIFLRNWIDALIESDKPKIQYKTIVSEFLDNLTDKEKEDVFLLLQRECKPRTPVKEWVEKQKNKISIRLTNILLGTYSGYVVPWNFIEEIDRSMFLRIRNAGNMSWNELVELRGD
jgi:hypothetical protein